MRASGVKIAEALRAIGTLKIAEALSLLMLVPEAWSFRAKDLIANRIQL